MKISRARMAQIANVTTRTIINWEKEKPELIRIIKQGIEADNNYKDFFKLFEPYKFWDLHDFYLDFYFRFLNYFRQNITLKEDFVKYNNKDIQSTAIIYLIKKHKSELFDKRLIGYEMHDIIKFKKESFRKPLFNVSEELSQYILKNTLDGFGLLVNDALYKDESLFEDSLKISITYLVHMFYPLTHYEEKEKIIQSIFENELNCNMYSYTKDPNRDDDKEKIYKNYLKFKKELFIENLDELIDELEEYSNNDFYVPQFIKEIENEEHKIIDYSNPKNFNEDRVLQICTLLSSKSIENLKEPIVEAMIEKNIQGGTFERIKRQTSKRILFEEFGKFLREMKMEIEEGEYHGQGRYIVLKFNESFNFNFNEKDVDVQQHIVTLYEIYEKKYKIEDE